jgi:glycosyltransferase involved in cell wall biosynthesis
MRILRLIASMDPRTGGPCQGIRNSIVELAKMGVHNEVVCLDSPTAAFLDQDPFPIHALGSGKTGWQYSAELLPWLLANMSRFEVLVVHGLWLYPSYAARIAMQQLTKRTRQMAAQPIPKLFIMPHGMLDPWFQKAPDRRGKALRNWLYWKIIENKAIRDADGILFTSETELLLARVPFRPYHPQRELNVGYGVQPPPNYTAAMQQAFQAKCPQLDNQPYFLFLSRIHEKKGVELLLQAYLELAQGWSQTNEPLPKLVIAGPGLDTAYGDKLQALVSKTELGEKQILFPGMLEGDAKWGAFYRCAAFVLPSHQENFGIAVAEALACGKPVLISNQVNIWREIEDAGGGLVADDTLAGTGQLLQQWSALTPAAKIAMGEQAQATFKQYFTINQAARKFKKAIQESETYQPL